MRVGLVQLTSSDDPVANLPVTLAALAQACDDGAAFVLTPEVTNCVSADRTHQVSVLHHQDDDPTLAALRDFAAQRGVWLSIGSLALKTDDPDGRFANRSFLIGPNGEIHAWYDKIHMFDVAISDTETYRESAGYRPGGRAVLANTPWGKLGLTICYDLRFPHLYRDLAQAGASLLTIPAAFSPVTGAAHWHVLLRARAIETGCFVLAAAQTGQHKVQSGRARQTYGHALVVAPWGEVLADAGTDPGVITADLDLDAVAQARRKVPSALANQAYAPPK